MTTKAQLTERDEAREQLRQALSPGSLVYTSLRHVSRSGMQRSIQLLIVDPEDHEISDISWLAARATGRRMDRDRGGIVCNGAGMDMGFDAVYSLSIALFCPDGYDHDAAYALNHRWI